MPAPEQMQQKGPTHGGDDDIIDDPSKQKKPKLTKFHIAPDANIRDVFWHIMGEYATKKEISKEEIKNLEHSRHSILRIAISILQNPDTSYYGLSPNFTAQYTLMLLIDASWEDAFAEFIVKSCGQGQRPIPPVLFALTKLCENTKYQSLIFDWFKHMVRERVHTEGALAYVSEMQLKTLVQSLKKELLIIARGDIERNQYA